VREKWSRAEARLEPKLSSVDALAQRAFPGAKVIAIESALGGLVNSNFKLDLSTTTGPRQVLLRYWQRNGQQAAKEEALLNLVAARVPVPAVLALGEADPDFGLPFAFIEWIAGEQLEVVAPRLEGASLTDLGHEVGAVLAAIHSFRFDKQGFFGADLVVPTALDTSLEGLLEWLDQCLRQGPGGDRLGAELTDELFAFVKREGSLLNDAWATQPCLTHSDFNASNILVRQGAGGAWRIAAILDWEFAFAGGPSFDFGNLLRPPVGDLAGFVSGVAQGYRSNGGELPDGWYEASRMADLFSWVDFLSQPHCGPAVIKSARFMIRRVIEG
jgi:aminoglycoside phosphotransferase (APT) family kinase protein